MTTSNNEHYTKKKEMTSQPLCGNNRHHLGIYSRTFRNLMDTLKQVKNRYTKPLYSKHVTQQIQYAPMSNICNGMRWSGVKMFTCIKIDTQWKTWENIKHESATFNPLMVVFHYSVSLHTLSTVRIKRLTNSGSHGGSR